MKSRDFEERQILSWKAEGYDKGYEDGYLKGYEISSLKKDIDIVHEGIKINMDIKLIQKILNKDVKEILKKAKELEII